jgi:DNA-binding transcriptional ArsR family regulator
MPPTVAKSDVFRALADPTRRAVLERLARGETTVSQLNAGFAVSQPAISQHLAHLRRAGLVTERRVGRHAYYRVRPDGLAPLVDWIGRYQAFWSERLGRLQDVLKEMDK